MVTGREEFRAPFDASLSGSACRLQACGRSPVCEATSSSPAITTCKASSGPSNIGLAAVDSATMAGLVANAVNKRVINMFQQYPRWWEPIVTIEKFTTLQRVDWITLGGVGELPTVEEGAAYTEWLDYDQSAARSKKGGYLGLTLEAIDRDDTRRLQLCSRRRTGGLPVAGQGHQPHLHRQQRRRPHHERRVGFVPCHPRQPGQLSALRSPVVDHYAGDDAQTDRAQLRERLGGLVVPKFLLVPPYLEGTASTVPTSEGQPATANNDANPGPTATATKLKAAAQRRVIVVDLWTDINNWSTVAHPGGSTPRSA